MFKDLFQSDSMQVELVLNKEVYQQAELVKGFFRIYNKKLLKIKRIIISVKIDYFTPEREKKSQVLYTDEIVSNYHIETLGDTKIPFQYGLPLNTPLSSNNVLITLLFKIEVPFQVPTQLKRVITIIPSNDTNLLLNAIQSFGFQSTYRSGDYLQDRQIFEFNASGQYAQQGLESICFNIIYDELYMHVILFAKLYGQSRSNKVKGTFIRNNFYDFYGNINYDYITENLHSLLVQSLTPPQNHFYRT